MLRFTIKLALPLLLILAEGCGSQPSAAPHDSSINSTGRKRIPGPVPFTPDPTEPPPAIHLVELTSSNSAPSESLLQARDPIQSGQPWLVRLTVDLDATGRAAPTALEIDNRWQGFLIPKFIIQSGTRPGKPVQGEEMFPSAQATVDVNATGALTLDGTVFRDIQALIGRLRGQRTHVILQPDPDTPAQHLLPILHALASHGINWYFSSEEPQSALTSTPTKVRYTLQNRFRELIDSAVARDVAAFPEAKPLSQMVLRLRCEAATPYREIQKFLLMNLGDLYDCRRFSLTVHYDGHETDIGPLHRNPKEESDECYWYRRDYDLGTAKNLLLPADTPPVLAYRVYQNYGEDSSLAWLARHQEADGHWDTVRYGAKIRCDTAATALCVLAFLGAGHTDRRGRWNENVARALRWLARQQDTAGCFQLGANGPEAPILQMRNTPTDLGYGPDFVHALCTLAFTETWYMSKSSWLKPIAERALSYAFEFGRPLNAEQSMNLPGWQLHRRPDPSNHSASGNLYISFWYIMMAASARSAGLPTNNATPAQLLTCLLPFQIASAPATTTPTASNQPASGPTSNDDNRHLYGFAPGESANLTATLLGNLARLYCEEPRSQYTPGAIWAFTQLGPPPWGNHGEDFDLFTCYIGTILSFQIGGDLWSNWNNGLRDNLIDRQQRLGDRRGSWAATGTHAAHGEVVATALGALNLAVYYRYNRIYWYGHTEPR